MKNPIISAILTLSFSLAFPLNGITVFSKNETNHDFDFVEVTDEILACDIKPERIVPDEYSVDSLSSEVTYDTYMEAYFRALTQNMGENEKGSCGYVAIGELLSYYDSYLSDSIIPEQYDVISEGRDTDMIKRAISPGILNDKLTASEYRPYANSIERLSAKSYYTIMQSKADVSLHAKLITIGNSLGYYNYNNNDLPCSTTISQRMEILKNYFSEIGLSKEHYKFRYYSGSSEIVKEFIREYVDQGIPVLASFHNKGKTDGHAAICYDYNESFIFANMGWSGSTAYSYYPVECLYNTYDSAMVVEFNLEHEHSYNYKVKGIFNRFYCYCDCNISTYKPIGQHIYTDHYVNNNDNSKHIAYCQCGKSTFENHFSTDFCVDNEDGQTHTSYCKCGKGIHENHSYTDFYVDNKDNQTHTSYCKCGANINEFHSWTKSAVPFSPLAFPLVVIDKPCEQCGAWEDKNSGGGGYF